MRKDFVVVPRKMVLILPFADIIGRHLSACNGYWGCFAGRSAEPALLFLHSGLNVLYLLPAFGQGDEESLLMVDP